MFFSSVYCDHISVYYRSCPLAGALKQCAEHVFSHDDRIADRVEAFDIPADSDADEWRTQIAEKLPKAPDSCLILTDIVGATPSNIAESMLQADNTAVLSGLNLPMVLTALVHRDEPLSDVVRAVSEAGIASAAKPALRKD